MNHDEPQVVKRVSFKGVLFLAAFVILTAAAIVLQIRFRGFGGPLSDNLLILILINANFLLLAAVIFMIGRSLWKLSAERRSKVLGAKFRTRLVAAFVSLSFIPTVLLFVIGSGIYTRGMERLFSLRLENTLQESVSVSQAFYDHLTGQARGFSRQISGQLTEERMVARFEPAVLRDYLTRKSQEYGIGAVELYGENRRLLTSVVTSQFPARTFSGADPGLVAAAFEAKEATDRTDLGRKGEIVRAAAPLYGVETGSTVVGAVAVSYYVSSSLTSKIDEIRAGYIEYRSAFKNKELLKLSYRLGFLAVMLTLVLAAIWVALRVAAGITVPIRKLAEGTVEVARGNLDYRIDDPSGDEVGLLVGSFNRMTADLKHSSEQLRQEVSNREIILTTIDAGVVSLDRSGRITTINPAASRILGVVSEDLLGRRYDDAFGFIDLKPIRRLFRKLEEGHGRTEEELTLSVRGRTLTLRMRVSTLRDSAGTLMGSVITFDDLTELLRAKKAETWQDVARKIAHEVKNPLTPIKLSAERLRKKYLERSPDFDRVFDESSQTIIQQVDGLKGLLDEFSEYARMPRPNPAPQALGPVVDSVVKLYDGMHKGIQFRQEIPQGLPDLPIDQEQMKRVFINLVKNAIEVMDQGGTIGITAQADAAGNTIRIDVSDDGPGISEEDVVRLFEPYFSRKKKGGGLGLAIVERIVADHNGTIRAERNHPQGARFIIELPVK
ncbi:MAG: ATP-binding protein [Nitrospirota bacterium]|nr:ATP-binding protein [Nitrospirota bacterium]